MFQVFCSPMYYYLSIMYYDNILDWEYNSFTIMDEDDF